MLTEEVLKKKAYLPGTSYAMGQMKQMVICFTLHFERITLVFISQHNKDKLDYAKNTADSLKCWMKRGGSKCQSGGGSNHNASGGQFGERNGGVLKTEPIPFKK